MRHTEKISHYLPQNHRIFGRSVSFEAGRLHISPSWYKCTISGWCARLLTNFIRLRVFEVWQSPNLEENQFFLFLIVNNPFELAKMKAFRHCITAEWRGDRKIPNRVVEFLKLCGFFIHLSHIFFLCTRFSQD